MGMQFPPGQIPSLEPLFSTSCTFSIKCISKNSQPWFPGRAKAALGFVPF